MNKYNEKYLTEKMMDFYAFRDGMIEAGYAMYVTDLKMAIMLYSIWKL